MIVGFGNCHGRLQVARFLRERGFCWQPQSIREQRLPPMFRLVPDR